MPPVKYLVPSCCHLTGPDPVHHQNYLENLGEKCRFLPHTVHRNPDSRRVEPRNTVTRRSREQVKPQVLKTTVLGRRCQGKDKSQG